MEEAARENLCWDESRVGWREGERCQGVWEGMPLFKTSPHHRVVVQQWVIKVARPPAVKPHLAANCVQLSSILALTASKSDLPLQLQLPRKPQMGVSSHNENERHHHTYITCLLCDSLVGRSLVWWIGRMVEQVCVDEANWDCSSTQSGFFFFFNSHCLFLINSNASSLVLESPVS